MYATYDNVLVGSRMAPAWIFEKNVTVERGHSCCPQILYDKKCEKPGTRQ